MGNQSNPVSRQSRTSRRTATKRPKKGTFAGRLASKAKSKQAEVGGDVSSGQPDPNGFTATGAFGVQGSVTITVHVEANSQRSDYTVYAAQGPSPEDDEANKIAYSSNQPPANNLGSTMPYTPGIPLYVTLTYYSSGSKKTVGNYFRANQVQPGLSPAPVIGLS